MKFQKRDRPRKRTVLLFLLVILGGLCAHVSPAQTPRKSPPHPMITDLGTLGGNLSFARAINDSGVIVGETRNAKGVFRAFRWAHGKMSDLGTLGGRSARATAINNAGDIVGWSSTAQPRTRRIFLWHRGHMSAIPLDPPFTMVLGISGTGAIVGYYQRGSSSAVGAFYFGGRKDLQFILPTAMETNISGISPQGYVLGTVVRDAQDNLGEAFVWRSGRLTALPVPPSANGSTASAINIHKVIVGCIEDDQGNKPYVWYLGEPTSFEALSTLGGTALAINDAGVVVGETDLPNARYHAALWYGGKQTDLDTLIPKSEHWTLEMATGINNHGQIIGWGIHNGHRHGFLVTLLLH